MVLLTFIEPKKLAEASGYDERYIKAIALTRLVTGVMYGMLALDIKDVFRGSTYYSL